MFRLMREQCSTCIFRPGNLMNLQKGRLEEITRETDHKDTNVVCHKSEHLAGGVDGKVWCRGSVDRRPGQLARIASRLNAIELIDDSTQGAET